MVRETQKIVPDFKLLVCLDLNMLKELENLLKLN